MNRTRMVFLLSPLFLGLVILINPNMRLPSNAQTTPTTMMVSRNSAGIPGNRHSLRNAISGDGQVVAFDSLASNLSDDYIAETNVFVRDLKTGQTQMVSRHSDGTPGDHNSFVSSLSADGRFVAFKSSAGNLDDNDVVRCMDQAGPMHCVDVFVHDRLNGETTLVSRNSDGIPGNDDASMSAISADGRYVAFESRATNMVADTFLCGKAPYLERCSRIFVHDRLTGETTAVSRRTNGPLANRESANPSISADGRFVVFESMADNLIDDDAGSCGPWCYNIFLHDRETGETTLVSRGLNGEPANDGSSDPGISADGRYVTFDSFAGNLTDSDTQRCDYLRVYSCEDVFVYDRVTDQATLISRHTNGAHGNSNSADPSISSDGRYIAFMSTASNLTDYDTSFFRGRVYVHDRVLGTTALISLSTDRVLPNGAAYSPSISASGRFVTFDSSAGNLVDDDTVICNGLDGQSNCIDIFLRDRGPIGRFVVYAPTITVP